MVAPAAGPEPGAVMSPDDRDGGSARASGTVPLEPLRPLQATLKGIASLVAPTSLVTALVYYFGWARTSTQASQLGLNDSLLGFSIEDYLLRSIDPMYWPLFVGVLLTLAGLAFHVGLVSWLGPRTDANGEPRPLDDRRRLLLTRLCAGVAAVGVVALVLGIAGANVANPTRVVSLWSPLCVTLAIVLVGYAGHLARRYLVRRDGGSAPEVQDLRFVGSILIVLLLLLSLFWSVARYAEIKGIDLAVLVERQLDRLPDSVVYSARRLHLPEGVKEAELAPPDDSAYRFRYSGLKLLFRSGDRVSLRPSEQSVSGVNIVLAESDELRFEFGRRWQP